MSEVSEATIQRGASGGVCLLALTVLVAGCSLDRSPSASPDSSSAVFGIGGQGASGGGGASVSPPGNTTAGAGSGGQPASFDPNDPGPSDGCADGDGDGYGQGPACLGLDCGDTDAAVNPGVRERCNGIDDDCDGVVDEAADDCGASCAADGEGFATFAAGACVDGRCERARLDSCGAFTCAGGGDSGQVCAAGCRVAGQDRDALCRPGLHCEADVCVPGRSNGEACDEDSDCESDHCNGGLCCDSDQCCVTEADCGALGGVAAVCDDVASCQGTRGRVVCEDNRCATRDGVPDDSGCAEGLEADGCGPYLATTCTGGADQDAPSCPSRCIRDAQCDPDAHCEGFRCVADLPDGAACRSDGDCIRDHCQNGFCCASGDCCATASDCPISYGGPPRCDDAVSCQGTRDEPVCEAFQCGTRKDQPNDSGCSLLVLADDCGEFADRRCSGAVDQVAPVCADFCLTAFGCDVDAYCGGGECLPDEPPGGPCSAHDQCTTGHCQNGFCCSEGDCCQQAPDCPGYRADGQLQCVEPLTCSGQRTDVVCDGARCQTVVGTDDGACDGLNRACGDFADVSCPDRCAESCADDDDCDPGLGCTQGGQCSADPGPGGACATTADCAAGLFCVDDVCCSAACDGTCERCDATGACVPIAAGQDPQQECAGLSCAGYYHGWDGSACLGKADLGELDVSCDGARACQGAASLCPLQAAGSSTLSCDASDCEQPVAGTCTDATAGACEPTPGCARPGPPSE